MSSRTGFSRSVTVKQTDRQTDRERDIRLVKRVEYLIIAESTVYIVFQFSRMCQGIERIVSYKHVVSV